MQRIAALDPARATPQVKGALDAVKAQFGMIPNSIATMAVAPSVLNAYLSFAAAVAEDSLPAPLRERIALAVAGANACDYCASAHQALGKRAGLSAEEVARNLRGDSSDARAKAALVFARTIVVERGRVTDADLAAIKMAGFSEAETLEIVANVALNIFTNYFNHVADTDVDFPRVDAARAAV